MVMTVGSRLFFGILVYIPKLCLGLPHMCDSLPLPSFLPQIMCNVNKSWISCS
jgi:hypothetical protein